jgi:serpin B
MRRFVSPLLALVLAGCTGGGSGVSDIRLAAADVPHLGGSAQDAAAAGDAINDFGFDLWRAAAGGRSNAVMSPASVALAVAMARAGARGQTADEIDAVLRKLGSDEHAAWVAALDAALNARTGRFKDRAGTDQDVTLRIVNAPFAQRDYAIKSPYLEALASRFGAGLRLVDYKQAPEAARHAVNQWVAGETEQRIKELLAAGTIDTLTRIVLVNAIYLKAAWQFPFEVEGTAPASFRLLDGTAVDVPTMHLGESLPYAAGDGWRAVELPYVGDDLALTIVVPDDLAAFESTLNGRSFASVVSGLASRNVDLSLPKFGAESRLELTSALAALGMPTAFTDAADFSGITAEESLAISAVIHQANIDVDEKGTEAAAATAVVIRATSAPADPITLSVDRPFLFALRDLQTGAVLFLGRIVNPQP